MNAESAYLFRHALLRDVAYQLQLPGDRARLHALVFGILEALAGGRPPAPPPLALPGAPAFAEHPADPLARELADHAGRADHPRGGNPPLRAARLLYLRRAAEFAGGRQTPDAAQDLWLECAAALDGGEKGEALRRAGLAGIDSRPREVTEEILQRALQTAREAGLRHLEGRALGTLATLRRMAGQVDDAGALFDQALLLTRETEGEAAAGRLEIGRASLFIATGRSEDAERSFRRSIEALRESDEDTVDTARLGLAELFRNTGRLAEARPLIEEVRARHAASGNRDMVAAMLAQSALLHFIGGLRGEAERELRQAIRLHEELGDRVAQGVALSNLGNMLREEGRFDDAEVLLRRALALQREIGIRPYEGITLGNLAGLLHHQGRLEDAVQAYRSAQAICREVGARRNEGIQAGNLGALYLQLGRIEEADTSYASAIDLLTRVGDRRARSSFTCGRAFVELAAGRTDQARAFWLEGVAGLRALGDQREIARRVAEMHDQCRRLGAEPMEG